MSQWNRSKYKLESNLLLCLSKFIASVNERFPDKLHQALLYGSYARGTWQEYSDVDIALIMDSISINEVANIIVDIAVEIEYQYGFCISPIGIGYSDFCMNHYKPLYKNIRNEGILLWEKN